MIQASLDFNINIRGAYISNSGSTVLIPAGTQVFDYGRTDSFNIFPLNSLFSTSSCTINNTNVSCNTQDIFAQLTRMNSARDLFRYNGTSPSYPDCQWGVYNDAVGSTNNPMGGFANNGLDLDFDPRGAFPATIQIDHYVNGDLIDHSPISTGEGNAENWVINVKTLVTEPLVGLSPWTWCDPEYNSQGILGVSNMSFVFNLNNGSRMWSSAAPYIQNITFNSNTNFQKCQLLLTYLSLQPTDVVETRNVVPFMDYPRFISNATVTLPAWDPLGDLPPITTISSNSIQLSMIPDKVIICARIPMSQQSYNNVSGFLPISNIVINFNNQSGILSSATQVDLWKMSMRNGSQQVFNEFKGLASIQVANGAGENVPTTGALLVLSPPIDWSIPNYLASGSQGNYNLQFNLSIYNTLPYPVTPEIVLICANSGIFVTSQGVSNIYSGILTKEMVLSTCEQKSVDPVTTVEYNRLVGGKLSNFPLTALHKIHARRMAMRGGEISAGSRSGGSMACSGGHHAYHAHGKKKAAHKLI